MGLSSFTDGGCILKMKLLSINKTTFTVTRLLLYLNLGVIESISVLHNSQALLHSVNRTPWAAN